MRKINQPVPLLETDLVESAHKLRETLRLDPSCHESDLIGLRTLVSRLRIKFDDYIRQFIMTLRMLLTGVVVRRRSRCTLGNSMI